MNLPLVVGRRCPYSYIFLPLTRTFYIILIRYIEVLLGVLRVLYILSGVAERGGMPLNTGSLRNHWGQKHVALGEKCVTLWVMGGRCWVVGVGGKFM